ncbi:MAG TPA: CHRD domain-containing protein [Gemmatimonadaceae bacterium]|nr:CHRD domain-containing protein [Gemmatimonadaceae bacterium]
MHAITPLVALAALALTAAAACNDNNNGTNPPQAETFTTTLSGANERPNPVTTTATGTATVTLSSDQNTLSWSVAYTGLSGNPVAAHIHGPFDPANPGGGTAPVIVTFGSLPAAEEGTITGSLPRSSTPIGNNVGFDSLVTLLRGGHAYVNIHTPDHPGGEIRGQLAP